MKKKILSILAILVFSTLFVSCWCPVGNPWDYEDIESVYSWDDPPYPLISGKGYHAVSSLEYYSFGSSDIFQFKAEEDVHCQFAIKFHKYGECEVEIDDEKIENPENGFNVSKGATVHIKVYTDLYVLSGSSSPFAEFYLYVD